MPFPKHTPSNENLPKVNSLMSETDGDVPWESLRPSDPPQPMFAIRFHDGRVVNFSYADLRETALRDAGLLRLFIYGFEKQIVTIEGRHLSSLQDLFSQHRVRLLVENGPRTFERPEKRAAIDRVQVDVVTSCGF